MADFLQDLIGRHYPHDPMFEHDPICPKCGCNRFTEIHVAEMPKDNVYHCPYCYSVFSFKDAMAAGAKT